MGHGTISHYFENSTQIRKICSISLTIKFMSIALGPWPCFTNWYDSHSCHSILSPRSYRPSCPHKLLYDWFPCQTNQRHFTQNPKWAKCPHYVTLGSQEQQKVSLSDGFACDITICIEYKTIQLSEICEFTSS